MENDFNKIAPVYDGLAKLVFGNSIQQSQHWLVQFIPPQSRVLLIGGGTGWLLKAMLKNAACGSILYLEASEKMLALSQKQYQKFEKTAGIPVEFRLGTEAALKPDEQFDVVFTGFLLDLFKPGPLQKLMQRLHAALTENGIWLVADFAPENSIAFWKKGLLTLMVSFFKIAANLQADPIPVLKTTFQKTGLTMKAETYFYAGLIRSAVYQK